MTKLNIFEQAVLAHAQWKRRLRQAIDTGESEWTVADVKADDRCDFGAWLQNLPPSKKMSEPYEELCSLHTEFHKVASEVLALALTGKSDQARDAMATESDFASVSSKLVLTLTRWAKSEIE